jgi:lipid A 4'-phosphatase
LTFERQNPLLNEELVMQLTNLNTVEKTISKLPGESKDASLSHALILLGLVSIFFASVPELDLVTSRLFWDPVNGFEHADNRFLVGFRDINRYLPWVVIAAAVALLIANAIFRRVARYAPPHKLLFVLLFFAIGPGLGVHVVKTIVGRARPRILEEFGGKAVFTPPWDLSDQCMRNCSFISGEAASAFALLTLIVFLKAKYVPIYLGVMGIVCAAFSFNRVVFGAHFLSDVVIAWSLMWVLAVFLWKGFSLHAAQIDAVFSRR